MLSTLTKLGRESFRPNWAPMFLNIKLYNCLEKLNVLRSLGFFSKQTPDKDLSMCGQERNKDT